MGQHIIADDQVIPSVLRCDLPGGLRIEKAAADIDPFFPCRLCHIPGRLHTSGRDPVWLEVLQQIPNRHCRFCGHELKHTFADLGFSPLANEYLREADLERGQVFYPLKVQVCEHCFLAQAALYQQPENIFGEYQSSLAESYCPPQR